MTYSFVYTEHKPQFGDCINKHAKVNVYFSLDILCCFGSETSHDIM